VDTADKRLDFGDGLYPSL